MRSGSKSSEMNRYQGEQSSSDSQSTVSFVLVQLIVFIFRSVLSKVCRSYQEEQDFDVRKIDMLKRGLLSSFSVRKVLGHYLNEREYRHDAQNPWMITGPF